MVEGLRSKIRYFARGSFDAKCLRNGDYYENCDFRRLYK